MRGSPGGLRAGMGPLHRRYPARLRDPGPPARGLRHLRYPVRPRRGLRAAAGRADRPMHPAVPGRAAGHVRGTMHQLEDGPRRTAVPAGGSAGGRRGPLCQRRVPGGRCHRRLRRLHRGARLRDGRSDEPQQLRRLRQQLRGPERQCALHRGQPAVRSPVRPGSATATRRPDCESALNTEINCGACGQRCSGQTPFCLTFQGAQRCMAGCVAPAPNRCGSICVDLATDTFNCGACGRNCSFAHAAATARGDLRDGRVPPRLRRLQPGPARRLRDRAGRQPQLRRLWPLVRWPNATSVCMGGTCSTSPSVSPGWGDCDRGAARLRDVARRPATTAARATSAACRRRPFLGGERHSPVRGWLRRTHAGGLRGLVRRHHLGPAALRWLRHRLPALVPNGQFCSGGFCQMDGCLPGFVNEPGSASPAPRARRWSADVVSTGSMWRRQRAGRLLGAHLLGHQLQRRQRLGRLRPYLRDFSSPI